MKRNWLSVAFCVLILADIALAQAARANRNARVTNGAKKPAAQQAADEGKRVVFSLRNNRDPMLSPDDRLLIQHRERQRLAALEAERRRKEEEERKRREEEERKRQWELALLKDPSMLIRNKIHIGGIIDKEVLIGNKLYTIGNTYMGAKIIAVHADSVTFLYKGQKFTRKVKL